GLDFRRGCRPSNAAQEDSANRVYDRRLDQGFKCGLPLAGILARVALADVITRGTNDGARGGSAGPIIADLSVLEQPVEAPGNHGVEERILVRVMVVESRTVHRGGFRTVLARNIA